MFCWSFSTFALMENKRFWRFLLFGQVFFAFALLVFVAFQWKSKQETTISVYASLCANAPVDLGVWSGEITVSKSDLFAAQEELERNRERVSRNFTAKGIAATDIEFLPIISFSDSNGLVLRQKVVLRSKDLPRLNKVASESGELLKFRVDFSANEVRYHLSNFSTWLVNQLPKLIEEAQVQARAIMQSGQEVKAIKSFKMLPLSSMDYKSCEQEIPHPENYTVGVFLEAEIEFLVK
jgi:hypothetical protein